MRAPAAATGLLALLVMLVIAAPVAAAGDLLIQMESHTEPVKPLDDPANLTGEVHVPCHLLHEERNGTAGLVELTVTGPTWSTPTLAPSRTVIGHRDACPEQGYATAPFRFTTRFEAQAPALTPQAFHVNATLTGGAENATGTHRLEIQPGYFSILDVRIDETTVETPPGGIHNIPIHVQNHGNGDTAIRFEVTDAPEGWTVLPPPVITVGTHAGGGDPALSETTATLAIHVPRNQPVNQAESITLTANGTYAYQPGHESDHSTHSIVVTVKGLGAPAPAAALIAASLALAATLHPLRRNRP